jgi:hypothetical protein
MWGWLGTGKRFENRLVTIDAELGRTLVFVRFVTGGAFFVAVTPLRLVACGARRDWRIAGMAAVAIQAIGMRF